MRTRMRKMLTLFFPLCVCIICPLELLSSSFTLASDSSSYFVLPNLLPACCSRAIHLLPIIHVERGKRLRKGKRSTSSKGSCLILVYRSCVHAHEQSMGDQKSQSTLLQAVTAINFNHLLWGPYSPSSQFSCFPSLHTFHPLPDSCCGATAD